MMSARSEEVISGRGRHSGERIAPAHPNRLVRALRARSTDSGRVAAIKLARPIAIDCSAAFEPRKIRSQWSSERLFPPRRIYW
jgi:hypothetical protein